MNIIFRKFGKLRIKIPQDILPGSNRKIEWICDCGREITTRINLVLSGQTTSCKQCNQITASEIATKKFGKLRIKIPQNINSGSHKKIEWICDCGKEKLIEIRKVLSGNTTSCKQCNLITVSIFRKFGKLRIKKSQNILPRSNKKIWWICNCGREKLIQINYVISNKTISCGQCSELIKNWYFNNREQIRALKCPVDPKDFIPGGIIPLEVIKRTSNSFKAICPACKEKYYPLLDNIKQGVSLTCGCSTYRISMPVIQITEYIQSLGFDVQNEFKVNKLAYDIFVPKKNLLIEFQGARWHSSERSRERDLRKKQNALNNGYQFMEILEKDWKTNKVEIENIINRN
jgi:predicted SprT family Zn-dependent metalloprotease